MLHHWTSGTIWFVQFQCKLDPVTKAVCSHHLQAAAAVLAPAVTRVWQNTANCSIWARSDVAEIYHTWFSLVLSQLSSTPVTECWQQRHPCREEKIEHSLNSCFQWSAWIKQLLANIEFISGLPLLITKIIPTRCNLLKKKKNFFHLCLWEDTEITLQLCLCLLYVQFDYHFKQIKSPWTKNCRRRNFNTMFALWVLHVCEPNKGPCATLPEISSHQKLIKSNIKLLYCKYMFYWLKTLSNANFKTH